MTQEKSILKIILNDVTFWSGQEARCVKEPFTDPFFADNDQKEKYADLLIASHSR